MRNFSNQSIGLKTKNQTDNLNNQNNDINVAINSMEFTQEAFVLTSRKVVIQMMNTILKNYGYPKHLSTKDNSQKLDATIKYIYEQLFPTLDDIVDWEKCDDKKLMKQKAKFQETEIDLLECKRLRKNEYCLLILIHSDEKGLWEEILKQYPNSEWKIAQNVQTDKYSCPSLIGTILMENNSGDVKINDYQQLKF